MNHPMKVLIVDDSASMRKILANILSNIRDFDIIEAENGKDALGILANENIELIISDWNMPILDGIDLLRTVRKDAKHRDIPFLMVTAEGLKEKVVEAEDAGATGFIHKPFSVETVTDALNLISESISKKTSEKNKSQQATTIEPDLSIDKCVHEYTQPSQFITFRIDDNLVGINIKSVREINRVLDITPVQHSPDYVRGLINLRGKIVTVFDLGTRLGLQPREITDASQNILLKNDDVGLLVDSIGDVVEATDEEMLSPPENLEGIKVQFINSVIRLPSELLVTLSPEKIIEYKPLKKNE